MSRDGKGERITNPLHDQVHNWPGPYVDCGGTLASAHGGRYRRCSLGHIHCTVCLRQAHRFGKAWTCGICNPKGIPLYFR